MRWSQLGGKIGSILVASLVGAFIAVIAVGVALYLVFAARGYTSEPLVTLPPWALLAIAGCGAFLGVGAILWTRNVTVSTTVQYVTCGCLAGVIVVVLAAYVIADIRMSHNSKEIAYYQSQGLIYGVPCGLLLGGGAGWVISRRSGNRRHESPSRPIG